MTVASPVSAQLPKLGQTFYQGETIDTNNLGGVHLEGMTRVFNVDDPSDRIKKRHGGGLMAILVRNSSTVNLLPKRTALWQSGQRKKRVDGYAGTSAGEIAGVVDPYLPAAGVPANDLFWLVVDGQVLLKTPYDNMAVDIDEGDLLYAGSAAATTGVTAGRVQPWNGTFTATQTTDGTAANIVKNSFARAISAVTTTGTDADLLADVCINQ